MVEAGGPAAQAGIRYQNTVAALYLGHVLDLRARSARDRVTRIVEAPQAVDDIVVHMADGCFFHPGESARWFWRQQPGTLSGRALPNSWIIQILRRRRSPRNSGAGEVLVLATNLRACCERTTSAADEGEYKSRLTEPQQQVISTIVAALAQSGRGRSFVHRLLSRTQVEIFPDDIIDRDIAPLGSADCTRPPPCNPPRYSWRCIPRTGQLRRCNAPGSAEQRARHCNHRAQ